VRERDRVHDGKEITVTGLLAAPGDPEEEDLET
jgi:hypothetical protein